MSDLSGWDMLSRILFGVPFGFIVTFIVLHITICAIPLLILHYKMVSQTSKNSWSVFIPFYSDWVMGQIAFGDKLGWVPFIAYAVSFIPCIGGLLANIVFWYTNYKFAEAFGLSHKKCILFAFLSGIIALYFLIKKEYIYIGYKEGLIHKYLSKIN